MLRASSRWALAAAILAVPVASYAQTPFETVFASLDITVTLGGALVTDDQIVVDDLLGGTTVADVGPLPAGAAIDALHWIDDRSALFSLATVTELGGVTYYPADVVAFDADVYSLAFDAAAAGVPIGADLDALTLTDAGDLLISFDVFVDLAGVEVADEDLASWDGSVFTRVFDGSTVGASAALDLDAAHQLPNGHLLLSFDGSGTIGAVSFADEDLVEYEPGAALWFLAYDGSAAFPDWVTADLDAVSVGLPPSVLEIPTLGAGGMALLAALLSRGGLLILRRPGRRSRDSTA